MFTRPTTGLTASWSQSVHYILLFNFVLISSQLCIHLQYGVFPSRLLTKVLWISLRTYACYMPHPPHPPGLNTMIVFDWVQIMKLLFVWFFVIFCFFFFVLGMNIFLSTLYLVSQHVLKIENRWKTKCVLWPKETSPCTFEECFGGLNRGK
jgi:hypothetical protein